MKNVFNTVTQFKKKMFFALIKDHVEIETTEAVCR